MNHRLVALGRIRGNRRGRTGTASVELAILLPFLVFLFAVGADWCRIYYAAHTLDECARSGALAASGLAFQEQGLTSDQREARGTTAALESGGNLALPLTASNIVVAPDGQYVKVTAKYDFQMIFSHFSQGSTWTISRSVRMPVLP